MNRIPWQWKVNIVLWLACVFSVGGNLIVRLMN
jgi:hypothetical protein